MDKIAHEEEGWAVAGSGGTRKNRRKKKDKSGRRDLESVESVVSSSPEESAKSSGSSSSNNVSMVSAAPSVEFNISSSSSTAQKSLFKSTKELFAPEETGLPNFAPEEWETLLRSQCLRYIDGAYYMRKGGRHSHTKEQKQEWGARKQREQQFRIEKRNNQREAQRSAEAQQKLLRSEAREAVEAKEKKTEERSRLGRRSEA
ncbi:hypothetical protein Pmar_PMAR017361 [Perkinsus marinus ATCC 50983]|uniref:Uncharacterized protein n=1 Tax=Perkinsus marinus (strain ATCC 50983 / TXsc) TaxID=423536 RepID=C5LHD7_PERM5|nr:hypothetical protein Pmar_PMAR017361 [Perkinsus marinus ATCC 50983]EER03946.1 hypothetical protein Pmar_PMAR017361 [Perkinsus marinus ATCC 50983]|eukprot:XP_002772130.1 hypothetical protein Pmar_PMAR017361 [Perkinsus marinus ATCC 50983]